jgi:hypothetical protein
MFPSMEDDAWSTRRSLGLENEVVGLVADRTRRRRLGKALRSQMTLNLSGGDIIRVLWDDGVESTHRAELLSLATADELERRARALAFGEDDEPSRPLPLPLPPPAGAVERTSDAPHELPQRKTLPG